MPLGPKRATAETRAGRIVVLNDPVRTPAETQPFPMPGIEIGLDCADASGHRGRDRPGQARNREVAGQGHRPRLRLIGREDAGHGRFFVSRAVSTSAATPMVGGTERLENSPIPANTATITTGRAGVSQPISSAPPPAQDEPRSEHGQKEADENPHDSPATDDRIANLLNGHVVQGVERHLRLRLAVAPGVQSQCDFREMVERQGMIGKVLDRARGSRTFAVDTTPAAPAW